MMHIDCEKSPKIFDDAAAKDDNRNKNKTLLIDFKGAQGLTSTSRKINTDN